VGPICVIRLRGCIADALLDDVTTRPGHEAPENAPQPKRERSGASQPTSRSRRFEQLLAIALGVVTMTGALLTYAAVHIGGDASGSDARSTTETLIVQSRQIYAETQARAFQGMAAQYRTLMSEADAVAGTDPGQAQLLRHTADTFAVQSGISGYLDKRGADARFDYDLLLQTALHYSDYASIPSNQPQLTAQRADVDHARSRTLTLDIVGLFVVVVLLTLARLARVPRARRALGAAAAIGYAVCVASAVTQVW